MSTWGDDLTILVGADFAYLPGAFALANSALENSFRGRIEFLARGDLDPRCFPSHPQLAVRPYAGLQGAYVENVHRLHTLPGLPPGRYLMLDADLIIERPAGILLDALEEGIVVSTEPKSKYDPLDVLTWRQCRQLGLPTALRAFPYVNGGFLGFVLPRDAEVIGNLAVLCVRHLRDLLAYCATPDWFFLEQDILNVLVRQPGCRAFSISPRQLELGASQKLFWDRPFPWSRQGALRPVDQLKYFIHGASLRRPWLMERRPGRLARLAERHGLAAAWRRGRRKLAPYERAWAFYACRESLPVPLSFWADRHDFTAHRSRLWRVAHGLR